MPALAFFIARRQRRPGPPCWIHLGGKAVFGRLQRDFPDCQKRRVQAFSPALELFQGLSQRCGLTINLQGDAGQNHPAPLAHSSRGGGLKHPGLLPLLWRGARQGGVVPKAEGRRLMLFANLVSMCHTLLTDGSGRSACYTGPGVPPDAAGDVTSIPASQAAAYCRPKQYDARCHPCGGGSLREQALIL